MEDLLSEMSRLAAPGSLLLLDFLHQEVLAQWLSGKGDIPKAFPAAQQVLCSLHGAGRTLSPSLLYTRTHTERGERESVGGERERGRERGRRCDIHRHTQGLPRGTTGTLHIHVTWCNDAPLG